MEMGTDVYVYRGWSGKIILPGRAVDGTRNADGPAPDGEEYFAMALFLLQRDGEMEKAFSITAARQEQFYGNVSIRESQGIQESRCGIRKII